MTTFDPDIADTPVYDDRPIRIPRVVDPVRSKRGRASRQRGHKAEREIFALIERACSEAGLPVRDFPEKRATSGAEDGHWDTNAFAISIEIKSRTGGWPTSSTRKKAWTQARNRCGHRTPVVIECWRSQGKATIWRVWATEAESQPVATWISDLVLEAKA